MVVFLTSIIYTFPIMSMEQHEEYELERQVDAVFEDAKMPLRYRKEIAAYALAEYINDERLAQDEQIRLWQEVDTPKPVTGPVPPLENQILARSFFMSGYASMPVPEMIYADEPELSNEPTDLSLKRDALAQAREMIGQLYNLSPRQVRSAEKLSRRKL